MAAVRQSGKRQVFQINTNGGNEEEKSENLRNELNLNTSTGGISYDPNMFEAKEEPQYNNSFIFGGNL